MSDSLRRRAKPARAVVKKPNRLGLYLSLSTVIHALVILAGTLLAMFHEKPITRLEVYLKPPVLPAPLEDPVSPEPESPPPPAPAPKPVLESPQGVSRPRPVPSDPVVQAEQKPALAAVQRRQLAEQVQAFYPDEYVQQQIEGDVVLKMFVDTTSGKVMAVRVEKPSPYVLFNEAARQAALSSITALTPGTPSEVLLPVRFRLGN